MIIALLIDLTARLYLQPGSWDWIYIPTHFAAGMVPFDPLVGDFRVHYAGFFDPGFGSAKANGKRAKAVLEVRSFEVSFTLEHGHAIGRLVFFEKLINEPDALNGGAGSNYQSQGLWHRKPFRHILYRYFRYSSPSSLGREACLLIFNQKTQLSVFGQV
jgi:deoxycytidine triphosphate deaminase